MSDAEAAAESEFEWVPEASDSDASELERVGRLAIGNRLDVLTSELHEVGYDVLWRAYDGGCVTGDDLEALRRTIEELEFVLETYVEPVVEESENEIEEADQ